MRIAEAGREGALARYSPFKWLAPRRLLAAQLATGRLHGLRLPNQIDASPAEGIPLAGSRCDAASTADQAT
jgi:hypothetical protein